MLGVKRGVAVQVLMHCIFASSLERLHSIDHAILEDAFGVITAVHVLLKAGCVDAERAACPEKAACLSVRHVEGCGAAEKAGSKVGFGGVDVESGG